MHVEEEDPLSDAALIKAARKRLLAELEPAARKAESAANRASVVNNIYGSGGGGGGGGLMDRMGGSPATPSAEGDDPYSYFVDVMRKDLPDINPATGKPAGWSKSVHRYKTRKEEEEKKK